MTETPALAHLMGAYFHQDWADEFDGDFRAAVDVFVAETPDLPRLLPAEVEQVLSLHTDDDSVEQYLGSLGCEYTLLPGEGGYRGWLTEIARRVREATSG
jgi:hypothetical protein